MNMIKAALTFGAGCVAGAVALVVWVGLFEPIPGTEPWGLPLDDYLPDRG